MSRRGPRPRSAVRHRCSPGNAPQQATLHLARVLVAERHAVAADLACGPDGLDGHDVDTHQDTYGTTTVRQLRRRTSTNVPGQHT